MIDCMSYVNRMKAGIAETIKTYKEQGFRAPKLAIVTDDKNFDANQSYIRSKTKFADEVGVSCDVIVLKDGEEFISNTYDYDGIIVQYPFRDYDFGDFCKYVTDNVPPEKDVDGLSYESKYLPCTPLGIVNIIENVTRLSDVDPSNIVVNVIGYGGLVGRPLSQLLLRLGYAVNVTRSKTPESVVEANQKIANFVVCATPQHNLITKLVPNTVYIDCGCNMVNGKLLGNVSRECYSEEAYVTPVPNGVGRMTVLALFKQLMDAYTNQHDFVNERDCDVYN